MVPFAYDHTEQKTFFASNCFCSECHLFQNAQDKTEVN